MSTYIGFSTQDINQPKTIETTGAYGGPGTTQPTQPRLSKKFRLTDQNLVIRDLINALSIRQGEKVGQPSYGTTLWGYLFEQNTQDNRLAMEDEIRRVVALDSRIILNNIVTVQRDNGVLFEMEVAFQPFNQAMMLSIEMDKNTGKVGVMPGV